ncbi:MAG: alkaline phosphatase family protein [Prevotella sp.]|nr:alkaline phosphatase family protein [Prevotella sp.]
MRYLAFILAAITSAEMQAFQLAPRLVVNITIDQLRSDYIEAFTPLYNAGGFRRIMREGLVYDSAEYPFSPVDKASATATLATGASPFYHGIIATRWLDHETLQPVLCVDDNKDGSSPQRLKTSTIGDELKINTNGAAIIYSFASNKEAAILSAGHAADGAFWIEKHNGWKGTSFYPIMPDWLRNYTKKKSSDSRTKGSANLNDAVVDASLQAIANTSMGKDDISDMLYVSLSATKADGSPVSHWQTEMESVYMQLDNTIERLINGIEKQISLDQVLFVLTSTGYTDESFNDLDKYRIPTGTFYINRTANLLNMYLGAIYGQGRYVEQTYGNQMYLNHKLIDQKRVGFSEILSRSQEFLVQIAGVSDVYTSDRLLAGNFDILKFRNGFNPANSGDITIEVTPGWKLLNEDTQQSYTSRAGFVPFPIIFMGAGIKAQHITQPVTVDRIAPTVAKAIRIRAPNACNASPLF